MDRTTLGTLGVLAHTMVELELPCQPLLPWELGAVRQVARFYGLDRPDRWRLLPVGVASDQQLVWHIAAGYPGGRILKIQVEVCPPGLVPVPAVGAITGRRRAAPGRGGSGLGPARPGGAVGRRQQVARGGPSVGLGGAADGRGGAAGGQGRAGGSGGVAARGRGSAAGLRGARRTNAPIVPDNGDSD